jgi:putative membrane-bound dehydrogenase-like protein
MSNVARAGGKERIGLSFIVLVLLVSAARAQSPPPAPKNTQQETIKLTTPEQAAASFATPEGFSVTLFASEPEISQPIGMTTDTRGRLWVAENNTYAESRVNFDMSQRDRVVILEDTDHDGRADKHTVFWDKAQKLTSVELGFGGVWALCPPRLLFIPDKNGDDVPDGEPEVVLDGWDDGPVRHNIANGLRWGPDGWLYGRHGIQATSYVGPPGTPSGQRTPLNCCVWRFHPTRKLFEVVCQGGTNSWGMDWNAEGELFFINTVIGHLWHAVPGAHFERMYGEDFNPRLYRLMPQTADHFHWDTAEGWADIRKLGVTPTTDQAGGGHAHSGMMIYQGDNWPAPYRGSLYAINLHGRRLNTDVLERRGAGYVGRHGPDILKSSDPWFRVVELISGSDGGVFLADWSDIGECHENDGVHRTSGRIYKVVHGRPSRPAIADIAALDDEALLRLVLHENVWFARQAQHLLMERTVAGRPMAAEHAALRQVFDTDPSVVHKLRALWTLYVTGGATDAFFLKQLGHSDEHVRTWSIRLLGDGKPPSADALAAFTNLASSERSGLVLLYLASSLQLVPTADRWPLAERLCAHGALADDPMLPLMVWYGIEPAVPDDPARALSLAASSQMPLVTRHLARRLTENLEGAPGVVDRLAALAANSDSIPRTRAILAGMVDALRGWRKAAMPASWKSAQSSHASSRDEETRRAVQELSIVFGDGRATQDLFKVAAAPNDEPAARRDAIRMLVEARAEGIVPLLRRLVDERNLGPDAVRGLGAFDDPSIPAFLIKSLPNLRPAAREESVVALCARPASARALLDAVAAGALDRAQIPPFQVRQMSRFPDESIRRKVADLWPELRPVAAAKKEKIDGLKAKIGPSSPDADVSNGRALFNRSCATCHTLFGQGAKIGPDLTGAQRSSLDYLLENIVDPAASLAADYRMSTIALKDGRVLNGLVAGSAGPALTIQTPTERLTVGRSDVEEIRASDLSLMPEGLLDVLSEKETRDLIGYLMAPQQVPLK